MWGNSLANAPDPELRDALIKAVQQTEAFSDRFEAEVWFTDMSYRLRTKFPDTHDRLTFLRMVYNEARRVDLTPELVLSVIQVESNFDQWAISKVGARGLMQVMPFWLKEIGRPEDNLFHIKTNLRMGCTILKHYLDKENGNLIRALGRYNGSLGSYRYPNKVMAALRDRWYRP
ncbi:MAG: lytic transglycosylase domain-containing protein [Gammaproteobacteria bacterium]|nr:lytic transglycosylase domain-containing protein [Gammaproteobacteria bacterium]